MEDTGVWALACGWTKARTGSDKVRETRASRLFPCVLLVIENSYQWSLSLFHPRTLSRNSASHSCPWGDLIRKKKKKWRKKIALIRDYHDWQDGSADNSASHQGWWPWLNLWDTEGRKKELTPPTYTVTRVHICTYKEIKICCLKGSVQLYILGFQSYFCPCQVYERLLCFPDCELGHSLDRAVVRNEWGSVQCSEILTQCSVGDAMSMAPFPCTFPLVCHSSPCPSVT